MAVGAAAFPGCQEVQDVGYTDGVATHRDGGRMLDATPHPDTMVDRASHDATGKVIDSARAMNLLPPFDNGGGFCGLAWGVGGGSFAVSGVAPDGTSTSCMVCPTEVGTPAILVAATPFPMPEAGTFVVASVLVRALGDAGTSFDASPYAQAAVTPRSGDAPGTPTPATPSWLAATETWDTPRDAGSTFLYKVFVSTRTDGGCLLLGDPTLLVGR